MCVGLLLFWRCLCLHGLPKRISFHHWLFQLLVPNRTTHLATQ
jgi:hypothetical protein